MKKTIAVISLFITVSASAPVLAYKDSCGEDSYSYKNIVLTLSALKKADSEENFNRLKDSLESKISHFNSSDYCIERLFFNEKGELMMTRID